eukprot:1123165-Pleurochrysis_carterae.AAC.1
MDTLSRNNHTHHSHRSTCYVTVYANLQLRLKAISATREQVIPEHLEKKRLTANAPRGYSTGLWGSEATAQMP